MSLVRSKSARVLSTAESGVPTEVDDVGVGGSNKTHFPNLDLLRSIAVGAVLFSHTAEALGINRFYYVGHAGVLLFFIHTAFVLLQSLDRQYASGIGCVWRRFYVQRLFRIYPLYLTAVVVTLAIPVPWVHTLQGQSATPWLGWRWLGANLALCQNLVAGYSISGPMWSLPFEMQMYLALPFVYIIAKQKERFLLFGTAALFSGMTALGAYMLHPTAYDAVHMPLTYYVPCFLGGAYAFALLHRGPFLPSWLFPCLVLCCVFFYASFHYPWVEWGACTILGCSLWMFASIRSSFAKQACSLIARYSYGIYLWHWPLLWLCFRRLPALEVGWSALLFAVSLSATSVASYHLIENPLIQIGRRFTLHPCVFKTPQQPILCAGCDCTPDL
jgi:peptidoglycan/LPS O-acetylase OafA/YrhL